MNRKLSRTHTLENGPGKKKISQARGGGGLQKRKEMRVLHTNFGEERSVISRGGVRLKSRKSSIRGELLTTPRSQERKKKGD